jgi:hypothetical protein
MVYRSIWPQNIHNKEVKPQNIVSKRVSPGGWPGLSFFSDL